MRKVKVLFFTVVPSPYQRDLFAALAEREDVDVQVCYMEASSPDSPWPKTPLRPFERILPGFWFPFGNVRCHVNWDFPDCSDVDFVVLSTFASVTGQWLMRAELRRTKWLFWGERLHQNTGLRNAIQSNLAAPIGRADGIVGIGSAAVEDYRRRFPHRPHFSIPYHCDLTEFFALERRPRSSGSTTFLFCGQMIERKGIDLLIAAFSRLVESGLDARLLLVGREAELPRILQITSPATRARIDYAGFQPPEDLWRYFERADAFVLPSRHDGWGVVVNQALAAGLPIIASDAVGAGLDYVKSGVNGLLVPANDVDALFESMRMLSSDEERILEWGDQSRKLAAELTPSAGADKWIRVFDHLSRADKSRREKLL